MYSKFFNPEEKKLFFELCIHACFANKVMKGSQKEAVTAYAEEMQISNVYYSPKMGLDDVTDMIAKNSDYKTRKMMFAEIASILTVDGVLDNEEKIFANEVGQKLDLEENMVKCIISLCKSVMDAYNNLNELVTE